MNKLNAKAAEIMLSDLPEGQKNEALKSLAEAVSNAASPACPDCGHGEVLDNGLTGDELTYCCSACQHHWQP
ncbi:hypothetical protein ACYPKM_01935 [Pseudomonas aeruginosa]